MSVWHNFKSAAGPLCSRYAVNIASAFWFAGDVFLIAAAGLGGAWTESLGGGIAFVSTILGLTVGHTKHGFSNSCALYAAGLMIQRWPHSWASVPGAALTMGAIATVCLPVILEPYVKERAQKSLGEFRRAGREVVGKTPKLKQCVVWSLANPRKVTQDALGFYQLVSLGAAIAQKDYYLIPVFATWLVGNRIARHTPQQVKPPEIKRGFEHPTL